MGLNDLLVRLNSLDSKHTTGSHPIWGQSEFFRANNQQTDDDYANH